MRGNERSLRSPCRCEGFQGGKFVQSPRLRNLKIYRGSGEGGKHLLMFCNSKVLCFVWSVKFSGCFSSEKMWTGICPRV